jgi:hypothetical protein
MGSKYILVEMSHIIFGCEVHTYVQVMTNLRRHICVKHFICSSFRYIKSIDPLGAEPVKF